MCAIRDAWLYFNYPLLSRSRVSRMSRSRDERFQHSGYKCNSRRKDRISVTRLTAIDAVSLRSVTGVRKRSRSARFSAARPIERIKITL